MKRKVPPNVRFPGIADPRSTLDLLWGIEPEVKPGPRRSLSAGTVGTVALALADEGGLQALSMRGLGARLGVAAMALYRYVPNKDVLLELVLEAAYAQLPEGLPSQADWQQRLHTVAMDAWNLYLAHPWMLQVSLQRPSLGPHAIRKYERELKAIEPAGLSDVEMDTVIASVSSYVRGCARSSIETSEVASSSGQSDLEWWSAHAEHLARLVNPQQFPLAVRVGEAAAAAYGGASDPQRSFLFGLERLIGGIALHIEQAASGTTVKRQAIDRSSGSKLP